MAYSDLFFDLDHTLWDFDANARETLLELHDLYDLKAMGIIDAEHFIAVYTDFNHRLWRDYHNGIISKEELRSQRFAKTFESFGLPAEAVPTQFEIDYVRICPTKTNLFPDAKEVLESLSEKYRMHIITNGFVESSEIKLLNTNIKGHFEHIFVSEIIGFNKPDPALFYHAMQTAGCSATEAIMIGDSLEADIIGARGVGMDQIFFNPMGQKHQEEITHEIKALSELLVIL